VPTLLIVGAKDAVISVESIVRSTAFLLEFELKMVEDAGHFPHQEKPRDVNNALLDFLRGEFSIPF